MRGNASSTVEIGGSRGQSNVGGPSDKSEFDSQNLGSVVVLPSADSRTQRARRLVTGSSAAANSWSLVSSSGVIALTKVATADYITTAGHWKCF
jgi:hypothetical protein